MNNQYNSYKTEVEKIQQLEAGNECHLDFIEVTKRQTKKRIKKIEYNKEQIMYNA